MTPRLRRYARALVSGGPDASEIADTLVHATLMRALGARGIGHAPELTVRLYATVTQLHRDLAPVERSEVAAGAGARVASAGPGGSVAALPANRLSAALLRLALDEREALLLVALEGFDHATAARILRLSRPVLIERLTRARNAFGRHLEAPASIPGLPAAAGRPKVSYLRLVVG